MITKISEIIKQDDQEIWCDECEGQALESYEVASYYGIGACEYPCPACNGTGLSLKGWIFSDDPSAVPPVWPVELQWRDADVLLSA